MPLERRIDVSGTTGKKRNKFEYFDAGALDNYGIFINVISHKSVDHGILSEVNKTKERMRTVIYTEDCTLPKEYLEPLMKQGLEGLPELVREIVNEPMQIERENFLQARPYDRSEQRQGHAHGYKPKTVNTRLGEMTFNIRQVRKDSFYPRSLEKGMRSEHALLLTLAEMYVQGISIRKVAAITEWLCGTEVSASQVSRAAKGLDEELEA